MDIENVMAKGLSENENDEIHGPGIIRSIGYFSLCVSLFLFLTIKIMKYLLARKKFKFRVENSQDYEVIPDSKRGQNNTPNSLTPVLKRSYTP